MSVAKALAVGLVAVLGAVGYVSFSDQRSVSQEKFTVRGANLLTAENGLLCSSSFRFEEAIKAMTDRKWLRDIGCTLARPGLPSIRLSDESDRTGRIQARVYSSRSESMTLWGLSDSFTDMSGKPLDLYGRAEKSP